MDAPGDLMESANVRNTGREAGKDRHMPTDTKLDTYTIDPSGVRVIEWTKRNTSVCAGDRNQPDSLVGIAYGVDADVGILQMWLTTSGDPVQLHDDADHLRACAATLSGEYREGDDYDDEDVADGYQLILDAVREIEEAHGKTDEIMEQTEWLTSLICSITGAA
jgi:hypothetical protein